MKQVQAKACMSVYDVYHLPLRLPTSPVKIQIPPHKWSHTGVGPMWAGYVTRTLSQVEVGALLQDSSQLPDTLVFSFRKNTVNIHRLTKEDKGPSPSSIA